MTELYDILEQIKKRPPAYLQQPSIFYLEAFLSGYFYARIALNLPPTIQEEEFTEFTIWIREEKYKIKSTQSWAKIIFFYSQDERDALDNFFKLLEKFKNQNK